MDETRAGLAIEPRSVLQDHRGDSFERLQLAEIVVVATESVACRKPPVHHADGMRCNRSVELCDARRKRTSAAAAHSGALGVVGQRAVQEPKLRRRRGEKARDSIEAAGAAVSRHRVRGCVRRLCTGFEPCCNVVLGV